MKEINKFFYITIITFFSYIAPVESKILSIGSSEAKVTVKVFSSLTCPHCANFHVAIFNNLKRDYIDKGLVKFEHHPFPLDLAALNAEVIVNCQTNNNRKFELPEITIPSKGFIVVWCDDGGLPNGSDIHATFKLSSSGEDLGIYYDDNGTDLAIDVKSFPSYPSTISEGQALARIPNGSENWEFIENTTPGSSNN